MRQLLSMNELSKKAIMGILELAKEIKKGPFPQALRGKILASCFFEPSTRTRLSFDTAILRLGGQVVGFSDESTTSQQKGETLHDAIKVIGSYVDALVIRHPLSGAAKLAAEATNKPVINAGDGSNEHPTQTLLDLFTIQESQGKLEGLNVILAGDLLNGRTAHSLVLGLKDFNPRFFFVAPSHLQIPTSYCDQLKARGIIFSQHERFEEVIDQADILYMTRLQRERLQNPTDMNLKVTVQLLKKVRENLRILHPLPRVDEIEKEVDATPYAAYFTQASNGVFVRAALLMKILGETL